MTEQNSSQQFPELQKDAKDGGGVAGRTRKDIEKISGKKVVSSENYLDSMLKQVRPENIHPETDMGPPIGKEILD